MYWECSEKSHFVVVQIWDSLATAFLHHRECNFRTGTKDTEFRFSHFNLDYFISSLVSSSFFYYTSLAINLFEFAMSSQTVPYHKQQVLHSITNLPLTSKWLHKINILLQHTFLPTKFMEILSLLGSRLRFEFFHSILHGTFLNFLGAILKASIAGGRSKMSIA